MRYRKKPVVINAIEWTGDLKAIEAFIPKDMWYFNETGLYIKTLEGDHHATIGDMIIQGVRGDDFYPCKPDIFKTTYDSEDVIVNEDDKDIHSWFELTYAQYLTIPRSILQSMPMQWQRQFVSLLETLDTTFDWRPRNGRYWVQQKDGRGKYTRDPFMQYRHAPIYTPEEVKALRDKEENGSK